MPFAAAVVAVVVVATATDVVVARLRHYCASNQSLSVAATTAATNGHEVRAFAC